jgi:hypothetical protein
MVRHDFYSINSPVILLTDFLKDFYDVFIMDENRFAIFGAPHEVVVDITNRVVISNVFRQNNTQDYFDYMVI